jgi:exodeoxyribonuclease VII large subunit
MSARNVLSVSQITAYIKSRFVEDELLADVWLSGEVSNFKVHTSGHCYFTLKDASACIKAVIWRTTAQRLVLPRDGDSVTAHGQISVYEASGIYQLYVDQLQAAGAGRLWAEYERLRNRLAAEGLFAEERKRTLPPRPRRLGVLTSATGAALRDILRTLAARYPLVEVVLAPATVQGDSAPPSIVAALQMLNRYSLQVTPLDVILVTRGGGALEELWCFNDERVARAIAASTVPVVTGVGHETDFTIADFAADVRAPTPTGAAATVTPDIRELREDIDALHAAATRHISVQLREKRTALDQVVQRARRVSPERQLADHRQRIDDLVRRGGLAMTNCVLTRRASLQGLRLQMAALDVVRVLSRGYAIITAGDGAIVTTVAQVAPGDDITVRVADGTFGARVR